MKSKKITHPAKCLALFVFAAIFLLGCSNQASENSAPINRDMVQAPTDPNVLVTPAEIENTSVQINKENFDQIKNGMSKLDVEILIAGNSRKLTSKTQEGVLKETYRWEIADGSKYIEVSFEDEKVAGKNQKGLK